GFVIHFLQLFQFSTENVVVIRTAVVHRDHGELTAGAQMVDDCAGHKGTRICRPAVVFVEADLLRRRPVDDRPLPQLGSAGTSVSIKTSATGSFFISFLLTDHLFRNLAVPGLLSAYQAPGTLL